MDWLNPDVAELHFKVAISLMKQEADSAAEAEIRKAIKLRPDKAEYHDFLARVLSLEGSREDEAEAECREAIRLKPKIAVAHNTLGLVLEGQGKVWEAIEEYQEAIRLTLDRTGALSNLRRMISNLEEG